MVIWIEDKSSYWWKHGYGGRELKWIELQIKKSGLWSPGNLPSGTYRLKSCCMIDDVQYNGTSVWFEWDINSNENVDVGTYYMTASESNKGRKKCNPCGAVRIFK